MLKRFHIFALLSPCLLFGPVDAKETAISILEKNSQRAASFNIDTNTPTSPGFVVIGATPKSVADPGNFKEFTVHTASFIQNGKIQPGLAVSFQPFWISGPEVSFEKYTGDSLSKNVNYGGEVINPLLKIFARTQFSLASVGANDQTNKDGIRVGAGFQTQLLDGQDPRNIVTARCLHEAWQTHLRPTKVRVLREVALIRAKLPDSSADLNTADAGAKLFKKKIAAIKLPEYAAAKKHCEDVAAFNFLQAPSWVFGAGLGLRSISGKLEKLDYNGTSVWSTFRYPFSENKAAVLFGKADIDQAFGVSGNQLATGNQFIGAFSLALEEPTWKLDATASYHFRDFKNHAFDDHYFQFSASGAYKVNDGVWIEASAGTRTNEKFQQAGFGQLQLKLDLSKASTGFFN